MTARDVQHDFSDYLVARMAHDFFGLIQHLPGKGASHSKVSNDDPIFGVFTPRFKQLSALPSFSVVLHVSCSSWNYMASLKVKRACLRAMAMVGTHDLLL